MAFEMLSDYIQKMQPDLGEARTLPGTMQQKAGMLAALTFGRRALEHLSTVNVAALALSMSRLTVYRPDAAAIRQVDETDLRNLPVEAPRLLHEAFLIESPNPASIKLFADVVALGGYSIGADRWLVCLRYPDGIMVTRWNPIWETGEEVAAGIIYDDSPLISDLEGWEETGRQAARFCIVLGLLLEAEATPLEEGVIEPVVRKPQQGKRGQQGTPSVWQVRMLTIPPSRRPAAPADETSAGTGPAVEGRHTEVVPVRGHLRYQAHGPGRTERKWVYIEAYEARRWVSPGPVRVNVRGE